ncbi:MAG: DMT family transporter [Candidatus Bathyarchaeia archaeon]
MVEESYAYAIAAVIMWSTVASAFKITLKYLDFLQMLFYASMVSLLLFLAVLLLQNKLILLKTYSRKEYLRSLLLGFLNPYLYYSALFEAYSLLPAQEALTLNYTWPIMVVIFSIVLLKQKIGWRSIFAILLSFFGVIFTLSHGNLLELSFSNSLGVLLAFCSAVIWALFWIFNMKDMRDEVAKLFLNFAFGFFFLSISILLLSGLVVPPLIGFLGAVYVGLFEMGATFLVWLRALKLSKTTAQVSNLIYLVPFLSLFLIHFIVGETILFSTIVGLVFIVSGIMLQQFFTRR